MTTDPRLIETHALEWRHNERILGPLIDYNMAYLLNAHEQGHVPENAAKSLIRMLLELRSEGLAGLVFEAEQDGLQPNVEAEVTRRIGADRGGWLSIGRARQECELVARQIAIRDDFLAVVGQAAELLDTLIALAQREAHTVMPYYTWAQHAEPITFGYFAAANAYALDADCLRLEQALGRVDQSRAGAGQVVPPPFAIDRRAIASLLGFSDVIPNSLYAYGSSDIEIEILAASALFSNHLARLSETLFVWASPEFGFLRFAPAFTGTSYAMPQKQNPYALRQVRPVAAQASAAWNEAVSLYSGSLQIVGNAVIHLPNRVLDLIANMRPVLSLLAAALPTLEFDKDRMREAAVRGWSGIPQLVFHLVQDHGVPFRLAHEVGGQVVRQAMADGLRPEDIRPEMVQAHVADVADLRVTIDPDALRRVLDVDSIVMSRTNGGPAPASVIEDAEMLRTRLEGLNERLGQKRNAVTDAANRLNARARAFAA